MLSFHGYIRRHYMPGKGKTAYYFPPKDADVILWIKNFVTVLASNAELWGIAQSLVTGLGALGMAYEESPTGRRV
jgi:hypothetical protein